MAIAACSCLNDCALCTSFEGDDTRFFSLTPCGVRPARFREQTTHLVARKICYPTGHFMLIGSIRRECLDHAIICGETHLRRVLTSYADCYNRLRTHRSLNKDDPISRSVQRTGVIRSSAILGGLHHHYGRI
jgi:hypothetical protein